MDTKWKSYSHSLTTKIIVFIIAIVCFTGAITSFVNVAESNNGDFEIVFEENYYQSKNFARESETIIRTLTKLIVEYKSEERILTGKTITEDEMANEEASYEKNNSATEDSQVNSVKERLIAEDLKTYNSYMKKLNEYEGVKYYASDGENTIKNSENTSKEYFQSFPSYMIFDKFDEEVYPVNINQNKYHYWFTSNIDYLNQSNCIVYVGFKDEFLNQRIQEWEENKIIATNSLYRIVGYLLGLIISFIYLLLIIGRKAFDDKEIHLNFIDKLYNDINLILCFGLITIWVVVVEAVGLRDIYKIVIPWTAIIAIFGLILVLSLVKHLKNKTLLKNTIIYTIFARLFKFIKDIYNSGSVGIKIAVIVILYPMVVAATFFIFPITIGVAVWLANKKVKAFNAIKIGVESVKNGDIHHEIKVAGDGEFAQLASNINSITDGLNNAVDNELKSERLKTELITNVSHDIRTPLTSIITYVDLLKKEEDKTRSDEYLEIIDQKSQRLKILTDDLFEAAKATSGNIPVNYEKIDIVSLITQGLGELNDKIEESELDFKISHPKDKIYINADGKLLWRAIENLLSNIFKYALKGSRVYIDLSSKGNEVILIIKNISEYELNISSDELMERFKRGDEARSSQGSGLGLSIAKSLVEVQKGRFEIEIDGDLFKAIIKMPATTI